MESKVFHYTFDFDEWPSSHTNESALSRPYHHSVLKLRSHYSTVFPEKELENIMNEDGSSQEKDTSKIYKIKYSINLLPQFGFYIGPNRKMENEMVGLFNALANFEVRMDVAEDKVPEIDEQKGVDAKDRYSIFATEPIIHYVDFKWS